jgi:hypothetical protein
MNWNVKGSAVIAVAAVSKVVPVPVNGTAVPVVMSSHDAAAVVCVKGGGVMATARSNSPVVVVLVDPTAMITLREAVPVFVNLSVSAPVVVTFALAAHVVAPQASRRRTVAFQVPVGVAVAVIVLPAGIVAL